MKFKYILFAAAALVFGSCTKSAIDPLDGVYPTPEDAPLTKIVSSSVQKLDKMRCFNVVLSTEGVTGENGKYSGEGAVLDMKLYGNKYFLEEMTYASTTADAIKKGFYLVGEGGSTYTRVVGGKSETVALDHGGISVSIVDGVYQFTGCIWLADKSVVRVNGSAALVYEEEIDTIPLTSVLQANYNEQAKLVTLQLATDGVTSKQEGWTTIYSGSGNYLALDIYSAGKALAPGTYKACKEGGKVGEGEFGIGYDTEMWGQQFFNWGTCWWTVDNGKTSAEKILDGTVTVALEGGVYTITLQCGVVTAQYVGSLPL